MAATGNANAATTFAYVPNEGNSTASVINTSTQTQTTVISGIGHSYSAAVAPNGSVAYVVDFDNSQIFPIDTAINTLGTAIAVGSNPVNVTFSSDSSLAYVSNSSDNSISVVDVAGGTVTVTVAAVCPVGAPQPFQSVFNGTQLLIVCRGFPSTVMSMDTTAGNALTTLATVGNTAYNMAISTAGGFGYVSNTGSATISKFDLSTGATTTYPTTGVGSPLGLAVTPDGSKIYVGDNSGTKLIVMDPTGAVTKTLNLGGQIAGIGMSSNGSVIYVPKRGLAAGIKVIDTATDTVVNTIANPGANAQVIWGDFLGNVAAAATTVLPAPLTPNCTLTATPSVIVSGGSSTLTASCDMPVTSYAWTNTGFATTAASGSVSPASTTTYSVTGVNANGNGNTVSVTVNVIPQIDVRSYFPAAAANSLGYSSVLRVFNTGTLATPVFAARIDGSTGQVGAAAQLTASLPAGSAATFTAQQVEAALGTSLVATDTPRIRITGTGSILDVQSLLVTSAGVWSDITSASSGPAVAVATYVPAAAATSGYGSALRVINTGTAATPVTVARIDATTGTTGAAATLTASLPAGAAVTYSAAQVEAALGFSFAASDRSRILVSSANSTLEVQSLLRQPGNSLYNVSTSQSGTSIDVRSYVPAAAAGYTSFLRVINEGNAATPVTAAVIDAVSGTTLASGTLIASLPANAAMTLSSAQVEAALGTQLAAGNRPRIRVTSPASTASLRTQSFLLQPGGAYTEISNALSAASARVRTYFPAANAAFGPTSYLRVINTAATSTPLILALLDPVTGVPLNTAMLAQAFPAGAAQTFSPAQIEAALGVQIAAPSTPNLQFPNIKINAVPGLEVQNFLLHPSGAYTEVSGGQ